MCSLCLAAALVSCASWRPAEPAPTPTAASAIRVGIVTSISGSLARFGQAHLQGYDLALQEINSAGGVVGEPLRLVFEDDGSDPAAAAGAVEKLATQDQVPVVIGAYSSSATLLAAGMAERYQVPLIVPTAAADDITSQGYRWIFRIAAPSRVYTQTILDFMDQVGDPERLAIVFENTGFGTSIAEIADGEAHLRGKAIVAYHAYQAGGTDFRPLLEQVKAAEPDAVLFVSYLDDAVSLMEQSRAIDFNVPMVTAAGAGFGLPDFPELAGPAAEYTISVTQWTPDAQWPGVTEFTARFRDKYGHAPQYHSAEAYVALHLAADALRRAATTDPLAVREALRTTQLTTIFGDISFDKHGQNAHPMLVTQVIDGEFVTVYPPTIAVRDPVYPIPAWDQRAGGAALEGAP